MSEKPKHNMVLYTQCPCCEVELADKCPVCQDVGYIPSGLTTAQVDRYLEFYEKTIRKNRRVDGWISVAERLPAAKDAYNGHVELWYELDHNGSKPLAVKWNDVGYTDEWWRRIVPPPKEGGVMLRRWTVLLPVFVVRWLAEYHCPRQIMAGAEFVEGPGECSSRLCRKGERDERSTYIRRPGVLLFPLPGMLQRMRHLPHRRCGIAESFNHRVVWTVGSKKDG